MKFLKRLRNRSKRRAGQAASYEHLRSEGRKDPVSLRAAGVGGGGGVPGRDLTKALPPTVLSKIFSFVCPHALDDSYDTSEESMTEDGCMLCDMRDLANCAQVCRRWRPEAQALLYSHVRIDAVHYCELEVELAAKRKQRHFDRNGDPIDAPQVRLTLLMRTVRDSQALADMVLSLRMPYMTREANKAELARTISVLPNLRFVDLPAGLYGDDPSCLTLKQELIARCPDLRRMSYRHGAEGSFARLPNVQLWANLEVLELSGLYVDDNTIRFSLSSFPKLRVLTLEDLPWLEDSLFAPSQSLPQFPAVQRLTLRNTPNLTASGLVALLSAPEVQQALLYLTLSSTGILPQDLHRVLSTAPRLRGLLVTQEVARSFPAEQVPQLASQSLTLLHYEITSDTSGAYGMQPVATSYYTYLVGSLISNKLPSLRDLYVRDANFPETLLLAPPPRLLAGSEARGPNPFRTGLARPLNVYSKGLDEFEWNFTPYEPPSTRGKRDSFTRPVSLQDAQLSRPWGGDARKSVLVGNGFGGFLAVPVEDGRPKSSGGFKRDSRQDIWR
ncbi:hypothetical protein ASPZODRAFT_72780 [Penicilliopsis zonata CBS 506.65]|uniref:F-box domain-containing protein n=1 Tax=Penicilliopsis zonata CBS 506.65 TaxID=1073090 RepID=A0A1L9SA33_9EURO|nr:hypothetical protein ASPZODRAFT_72780 [Penicilliopsis zonata CBS 506.65]OJJ44009.1 hypothetical protein ASPZODRAFT_72780 [Penicilliopsis zonata CBS 506.65]